MPETGELRLPLDFGQYIVLGFLAINLAHLFAADSRIVLLHPFDHSIIIKENSNLPA